uniref:Uncharacterized protein n=1 Tax=Panagrolaimus superbus TaxID=310955 RepID=A0A914ZC22_9BILA
MMNTNEQPLPENIEHKNEKIETVAVAAVAAAIVINPSENQNLTNDGEIESDYMSDESSTDSSLTSESESEIVDNEDGSGLEHKSLKSKIGKIFGRKGCKKGRKGKKGCKKPKHCKRGRNGKCCKRGVDENGKCRKGFPGRIAERLVNVTKEKIENKVNKWADKITGNGKGTNGNQAQSNNSGN